MFFDGIFYNECEEYLYRNILVSEIEDSTSTEYLHLKKEIFMLPFLTELNIYSRMLIPMGCIIRSSSEKLYLCYSILPIKRDDICYGVDPSLLILARQENKLDKNEQFRL